MSTHSGTATGSECVLCGGPCREPLRLPPIHSNYPFMNKEAIAMTQPVETPPEPAQPVTKRAKRKGENRAHTPGENR